jgi:predicted ATPase/DNA-binding SARP family transcriptional activator
MPSLSITLLGPVQVTSGTGEPITFPYDKVTALLAYLAVEGDRAHRRESLAAIFWPEQDERAARHSLSQALWSLRRAVGDTGDGEPALLLLTRDTVQINPAADIWLDSTAFTTLLAQADLHASAPTHGAHGGLCRHCARQVEQAVDLYRGPFVQEGAGPDSVAFDEWSILIRERLHQAACRAFERLSDHLAQRGDIAAAIARVRRQIELDPLQEDAHRRLIALLATTGQRGAALEQYQQCARLLLDELDVEPEPETTALYLRIRAGTAVPPRHDAPAASSLPTQTTPFVGREREIDAIVSLLDAQQARVITLIGPGGIGKTRLALRAAETQRGTFRDGVHFVPLVGVTDPAMLPGAIAGAIGAAYHGDHEPIEQLVTFLKDREQLIVLDNAEQLVNDAAGPRIIAQLVEHAPRLYLIVTSRERLHLQAEAVFVVDGLDLPDLNVADPTALSASSAVQLFLTAARRTSSASFSTAADLPAIARVCQLVGCMPLGIELAAAWTSVLSPAEIAREIERSLDFLAADLHDIPDRHRSVRAVFDRSWEMLTDDERQVFQCLSVFRNGFQRAAAEWIAGATLPVLAALVGKSLLRRAPDGRYELHELVRQYADARLNTSPDDVHAIRERHGTYFMRMLVDQEARLKGHRQAQALADIQREMDNLRAAWEWAAETRNAAAMLDAIHPYWLFVEVTACYPEGRTIFLMAMDALEGISAPSEVESLAYARLLTAWSSHFIRTGTRDYTIAYLDHAIERLTTLNAERDLGLAFNFRAMFNHARRNFQEEQRDLTASIEHFRQAGDRWGMAYSLNDLGMAHCALGQAGTARELHTQSLAIFRELDDQRGIAFALTNLGIVASSSGEPDDAIRFHREALAIRRAIDHHWGIAINLIQLGNIARRSGYHDEARRCLLDALRIGRDIQSMPAVLSAVSELAILMAETGEWDLSESLTVLQAVAQHPDADAALRTHIANLRTDGEYPIEDDGDGMPVVIVEQATRKLLTGTPALAFV